MKTTGLILQIITVVLLGVIVYNTATPMCENIVHLEGFEYGENNN